MIWPVVWVGVPCALVGAALGAHCVALLDSETVRRVILVALPTAAVLVLLPKPRGHVEAPMTWRSLRLWIAVPLIGATIGFYDGIFGPGTGSFLILAFYGIGRLSFLHSAAVGRLFNLVSNFGALVTFIMHGKVLFALVPPLALASIVGHYCGSHLAIKRGDRMIRGMLMVSCTLLFAYLLWEHF